MSAPKYKAFYDRTVGAISGAFTIQENLGGGKVKKHFARVPSRSGQYKYVDTRGVRGKSPIPYGKFKLWLTPINEGQPAGTSGIGEAFPISDFDKSRWYLNDNGTLRVGIMLHDENSFPGSAGCIVIVPKGLFKEISKLLKKIKATEGLEWIELEVI